MEYWNMIREGDAYGHLYRPAAYYAACGEGFGAARTGPHPGRAVCPVCEEIVAAFTAERSRVHRVLAEMRAEEIMAEWGERPVYEPDYDEVDPPEGPLVVEGSDLAERIRWDMNGGRW